MFPAAGLILALLMMIWRNMCFPPHLVVTKWLANLASCSTRRCTEWRVGFPKIQSSGTAYILPLTILVMAATIVVVAAMVAPFMHYKE